MGLRNKHKKKEIKILENLKHCTIRLHYFELY